MYGPQVPLSPQLLGHKVGLGVAMVEGCVVGGYNLKLMLAKNIVKYNFREQKVKK